MTEDEHILEKARELRGNWRKFVSFGWHDRPDDAEEWCIVYTNQRDAGCCQRSNARVYEKALSPFLAAEDSETMISREHHGHWAVGHVDGYSIRVLGADGKPTPAFVAYAALLLQEENYPILDEEDHSAEEEADALETWKRCYSASERIEYIRKKRSQFEFHDWRELLSCVRGETFCGYASELAL